MRDIVNLADKYQWNTRGENCPLCDAMAGRVYTYDIWVSASVLPGFHLGCDCYLKKVSAEYPLSDLDIFGSDFDLMLDNHTFLGMNWKSDWKSYNWSFTSQLTDIMRQNGMSIGEALKSISNFKDMGWITKSITSAWDLFYQWRVFRSLQLLNKSGDGETISATLEPKVTIPTAPCPCQTYHSGTPEDHF